MRIEQLFNFNLAPDTTQVLDYYRNLFLPEYYKVDKNSYIPFCNVLLYRSLFLVNLQNRSTTTIPIADIMYNKIKFIKDNSTLPTFTVLNRKFFNYNSNLNLCKKKEIKLKDFNTDMYFSCGTILDSNFNTLLSIVLDGETFLSLLNLGYTEMLNSFLDLDVSKLTVLISSKLLNKPYVTTYLKVFNTTLSFFIGNSGMKTIIIEDVEKFLYCNNRLRTPDFSTFKVQDSFVEGLKKSFYES